MLSAVLGRKLPGKVRYNGAGRLCETRAAGSGHGRVAGPLCPVYAYLDNKAVAESLGEALGRARFPQKPGIDGA